MTYDGYIKRTRWGWSLFTSDHELVASESYERGQDGLRKLAGDLEMTLQGDDNS